MKKCKYCNTDIDWATFEFAPSVWFHVATEQARCDPNVRVATPDE